MKTTHRMFLMASVAGAVVASESLLMSHSDAVTNSSASYTLATSSNKTKSSAPLPKHMLGMSGMEDYGSLEQSFVAHESYVTAYPYDSSGLVDVYLLQHHLAENWNMPQLLDPRSDTVQLLSTLYTGTWKGYPILSFRANTPIATAIGYHRHVPIRNLWLLFPKNAKYPRLIIRDLKGEYLEYQFGLMPGDKYNINTVEQFLKDSITIEGWINLHGD